MPIALLWSALIAVSAAAAPTHPPPFEQALGEIDAAVLAARQAQLKVQNRAGIAFASQEAVILWNEAKELRFRLHDLRDARPLPDGDMRRLADALQAHARRVSFLANELQILVSRAGKDPLAAAAASDFLWDAQTLHFTSLQFANEARRALSGWVSTPSAAEGHEIKTTAFLIEGDCRDIVRAAEDILFAVR